VVIVVQIVSGGVGLNLQFCKRILFLSQHWNPAVVHQAVGRAVRIGQRAVVEVHTFRLVDDVMDNIDRKMVETHQRKIDDAKDLCSSLYEGYEPLDKAMDGFLDEESASSVSSAVSADEDPC
jgi:SNF2 family DNA or RNA helicase